MFTHLLVNDNSIFMVTFSEYAKKHNLKRFEKDYPGKQWETTAESILQDLSRIRTSASDLQKTQQVDELWQKDNYWIFKYDFRVAQTKESAKTSGNRCIAFLDNNEGKVVILLIYGKGDLPESTGEHAYIENTLNAEFAEYMALVS